jgi:hypothetical protein
MPGLFYFFTLSLSPFIPPTLPLSLSLSLFPSLFLNAAPGRRYDATTRIRDFQLEHLINTSKFPEVERRAGHSTAKARTKCLRRSFEKGKGQIYMGLGGRIAKINLLAVVSEPLVPYVLHVRRW